MFTSAQNAFWQAGTVTTATGTATVTVNTSTTFQTFTGFGGAINELGWQDIQLLSAQDQAAVLAALFDPNNGANFLYGRIPIGANDYATLRYTDDEVPSGMTDMTMANFSITQDLKFVIPFAKAALAVNPNIKFWGSAWTPPTWMKTNSGSVNVVGTNSLSCAKAGATAGFDGGCMKGDTATLNAYALYLSKWVQAYGAQGLPIQMIVPQNEPSYPQGYPSCLWDPPTYAAFIPILGNQLKGTSTQIFLGTMSKGEAQPGDVNVMAAVAANSSAMSFVKGFALQWNMQQANAFAFSPGSPTVPNTAVNNWVTTANLPIWQTEHRAGNYPFGSPEGNGSPFVPNCSANPCFNASMAPNDYNYAIESWGLITAWIRAGVNSYSAWNMVLDQIGLGNDDAVPTPRIWPQDSLIVVNTNTKKATLTPAYFVFRHFSQYVQPGAVRVATSGALDTIAFKNPDGSIVTILYNSGSSAAQTTLSAGGSEVQFTVPAGGFATVVK